MACGNDLQAAPIHLQINLILRAALRGGDVRPRQPGHRAKNQLVLRASKSSELQRERVQ